jgi:hypothetical protein
VYQLRAQPQCAWPDRRGQPQEPLPYGHHGLPMFLASRQVRCLKTFQLSSLAEPLTARTWPSAPAREWREPSSASGQEHRLHVTFPYRRTWRPAVRSGTDDRRPFAGNRPACARGQRELRRRPRAYVTHTCAGQAAGGQDDVTISSVPPGVTASFVIFTVPSLYTHAAHGVSDVMA